jgi:hypothetical protein
MDIGIRDGWFCGITESRNPEAGELLFAEQRKSIH